MFNPELAIDALFEEMRTLAAYTEAIDLSDATALEANLQRKRVEWPFPSRSELGRAIEIAFWASVTQEEGRPTKFNLGLVVEPSQLSNLGMLTFSDRVPLTAQSLRRLAPGVDATKGYIIAQRFDDEWQIIGTAVQSRLNQAHPFTISVSGPGEMRFSWRMYRLVSLAGGKIERLSEQAGTSIWLLDTLCEILGMDAINQRSELVTVLRAVDEIRDLGHGGSLWISTEAPELSNVNCRYRVVVDPEGPRPLCRLAGGKDSVEPDATDVRRAASRLASLTGVDGAVVLDRQLNVIGYGAFVEVPAILDEVEHFRRPNDSIIEAGNTVGGGRHRSALHYSRTNPPTVVIVVSQDGAAKVFISRTNGTITKVEYRDYSDLGFNWLIGDMPV